MLSNKTGLTWCLAGLLVLSLAMAAGATTIGGGGGPAFGVLSLDLSELNAKLEAYGFNKLDGQMIIFGGGGFGGVEPGWNVGGFGAGGVQKSFNGDRKAEFSIGFGGFLAEYRKPFLGDKLVFTAGSVFGGGGADLNLLYGQPTGGQNVLENPHSTMVTRSFLVAQPQVGLQYRLNEWMSIGGGAGYLATMGVGSWTHAGMDVGGLPEKLGGLTTWLKFTFGGKAEMGRTQK
ncbi:MAG: hypothetical protein M1379_09520 [Firmicutes bacterium]|nr:hypothetical protein [Bacillota bacterium]